MQFSQFKKLLRDKGDYWEIISEVDPTNPDTYFLTPYTSFFKYLPYKMGRAGLSKVESDSAEFRGVATNISMKLSPAVNRDLKEATKKAVLSKDFKQAGIDRHIIAGKHNQSPELELTISGEDGRLARVVDMVSVEDRTSVISLDTLPPERQPVNQKLAKEQWGNVLFALSTQSDSFNMQPYFEIRDSFLNSYYPVVHTTRLIENGFSGHGRALSGDHRKFNLIDMTGLSSVSEDEVVSKNLHLVVDPVYASSRGGSQYGGISRTIERQMAIRSLEQYGAMNGAKNPTLREYIMVTPDDEVWYNELGVPYSSSAHTLALNIRGHYRQDGWSIRVSKADLASLEKSISVLVQRSRASKPKDKPATKTPTKKTTKTKTA